MGKVDGVGMSALMAFSCTHGVRGQSLVDV